MRDRHDDFVSAGINLAVIGQSTPEDLTTFLAGRSVPYPAFCDPQMWAYRAFGLQRGSNWDVALNPRVVAAYAAAATEGHNISKTVGDRMQLPGSFVVAESKIVFAHRGQTASDLTPPQQLIDALTT